MHGALNTQNTLHYFRSFFAVGIKACFYSTFSFINIPIKPLKPKAQKSNIFVQSVPQRKHFTITKISWLMLFEEIIIAYSENRKVTNTLRV
jgi:hypothetical protein